MPNFEIPAPEDQAAIRKSTISIFTNYSHFVTFILNMNVRRAQLCEQNQSSILKILVEVTISFYYVGAPGLEGQPFRQLRVPRYRLRLGPWACTLFDLGCGLTSASLINVLAGLVWV